MKLKQLFSTLTAIIMAMSVSVMPAMAADQTTSEAGSKNATVSYSKGSSFTVTIPATIALDTNNKSATYNVNAKGDIFGNQKVTVTPGALELTDANGKSKVTATVSQEKKDFSCAELAANNGAGTTTSGKITANGLTAGVWNGTLTFAIAVNPAR